MPDDAFGVDTAAVAEANRTEAARSTNRYLKRIRYGSVDAWYPSYSPTLADPPPTEWMFEAVFDYGDHGTGVPTPMPPDPTRDHHWPARADAFSSHRAGFEVRTYRLCQRVLMFHHFAGVPGVGADCLVRSTEFDHALVSHPESPLQPGYTTLRAVTHRSWQKHPDTGSYHSRDLPPVEFTYSKPQVDPTIRTLAGAQLANLPVGTQGPGYRWVDLDGEGLSGVLAEQAGAWYYKPNRGDGTFGPVRQVSPRPAMAGSSSHQLMDLAGNGAIDVVDFAGPTPGFHERDDDEGWKRHVPFAGLPNIDWQDPNLRFVDLTGDGHADALITEHEVFTWYPSLDERGFAAAERTRQAADEDAGPRVVFADGTQTLFLADMCGDGLTGLVRIRNGQVCYWPNLGYGRFGRKVTLGNSPRFDHPDLFDPNRIRLTDIDGSGPIDIIYLGRDGARLYFNRSGNSLSDALTVDVPVATENLGAVQVADLLGNGTACLVWNSHLPADAAHPVRYIDLMSATKPHLLTRMQNNLGGSTEIEYTPSTRFYLQDLAAGTPWITRLPFPVHCVSKVTARDQWRGTAFSSSYSYHHGYFDGTEREFRGFGRVDQVDVEDFGTFREGNAASPWVTDDQTLYQPPVHTITWYHTGAAFDRQRILTQFEHEYFPRRFASQLLDEPGAFVERALPEPQLPADLTADEWREALRACKGMVLRQEVYELDIDGLTAAPPRRTPVRLFSVATHNCRIQRLQRRGTNRHAVFLVTESEAITYHHELALRANGGQAQPIAGLRPDPRIAHTLNLRDDEYGNPQQSISVGYGRWRRGDYPWLPRPQLAHDVQGETHIAYSETHYTGDVELDAAGLPPRPGSTVALRHRRLRLPCETLTYELKSIARSDAHYFALHDFAKLDLSPVYGHQPGESLPPQPVGFKPYHDATVDPQPQKRLVEHVRALYFDDASDAAPPAAHLPFAHLGPRGLKYQDYKLALTEDLLSAVFGRPSAADPLADKLAWHVQAGLPARALLTDPAVSGYVPGAAIDAALTDQYWMRSGTAGFASDAHRHFFLPETYTDPFDNVTTLAYDARDLFVQSSEDALHNRMRLERFDYRVLAPAELVDINGNQTEAAFDIHGLAVALAVKGKRDSSGAWEADNLDGWTFDQINPTARDVAAFCTSRQFGAAEEAQARRWLATATTRFIYHFGETRDGNGAPTWTQRMAGACAVARETHVGRLAPGEVTRLQISLECTDGSGAVLMKKMRAEPEIAGLDPATPAQFVIDDFSSGPFQASYETRSGADVTDSQIETGTMRSGQRRWDLLLRGNSGLHAAVETQGAHGFRFTSDIGVAHRFDWHYGTQAAPMSLDLRGYNALRLHFLAVPRGLNFNVLLYFRGQPDNYAQLGVNIVPHDAPFDLDFSFDSFRAVIADPSRPADFSQVSSIYIVTQSGGYVGNGGEGFTLAAVSAVSLPRWVVNGLTVLNNKGKPVKQYEPAFSADFGCEIPRANGVSTTMFYDAAGRPVRTEFPDGTLSRVAFSPWETETWDQNDTVLESRWYASHNTLDPAAALEIGADGLVKADHAQRAGWLAARHAGTPARSILDSLGRQVIAVAHNRVEDPGGPHTFGGKQWQDEFYVTFSKLDAEGKPLWIRDARDNLVMQYITPAKPTRWVDQPDEALPPGSTPCYDIAGNLLHQHSMDAGDRWMLMDAAGKPMLAWDANEFQHDNGTRTLQSRIFHTEYDALRRPTRQWLTIAGPGQVGEPALIEAFEYRDTQGLNAADLKNARDNRLIGQAIKHWDPSGLATMERIALGGQPAHITRTLIRPATENSQGVLDWQDPSDAAGPPLSAALEAETFHQLTEYDALGRMTRHYNWHRDITFGAGHTQTDTPGATNRVAVYEPHYNERGALVAEWLHVRASKATDVITGTVTFTPDATDLSRSVQAIRAVTYNAKGQKLSLTLGNGTVTTYTYDEQTQRLRALRTRRPLQPGRPSALQDLEYTYDSVGNIIHLNDAAQEAVWSRNAEIRPERHYVYDALYRLIEATGRENTALPSPPKSSEGAWPPGAFPAGDLPRKYTQRYVYDVVGNFLKIRHATDGAAGWTRHYTTRPDSNRLDRTWYGNNTAGAVTYGHDLHGSMLNLNRLDLTPPIDLDEGWGRQIEWDWRDMIRRFDAIGGGMALYCYGSNKQRTRKHITRVGGTVEDRLYLDGLELYRRRNSLGVVVEEIESQHRFEGERRVLLVDDVISTDRTHSDGTPYRTQPILRYQYGDHLGSVALELDEVAPVISYEEFHPYGTSAFRLQKTDIEAPARRYRYTGMENDEESGLGYHAARYSQHALGRWISADPKGPVDGLHLYSYCGGNPIGRRDFLGTQSLGENMEELRLQQQAAANTTRSQANLKSVNIVDQPIIDKKGNLLNRRTAGTTVPDEVRTPLADQTRRDPGSVLQLKARNVQSASNSSADAMAQDMARAVEQTGGDVRAAVRAGLVARNAKGQVLVIIADAPKADPKAAQALAQEIKTQIKTGEGVAGEAINKALEANPNVKGVTVTTAADIARARDASLAATARAKQKALSPKGSMRNNMGGLAVQGADILYQRWLQEKVQEVLSKPRDTWETGDYMVIEAANLDVRESIFFESGLEVRNKADIPDENIFLEGIRRFGNVLFRPETWLPIKRE